MNAIDDLRAGRTLRGDNAPLMPSLHAVKRWREPFRPGLSDAEARFQLQRQFEVMVVAEKPPPEHTIHRQGIHHGRNFGYASLASAVFPIELKPDGSWMLTTCLAPDLIGATDLAKKRAAGQKQRSRRRTKATGRKPRGRPQSNERWESEWE